ncbi:hypothetical protein V0288_18710 [Pannus brasiliensis CCIBt3594]|uniref:Uncharacterized protein n=1 Tax=Pannus brasiliensis CCIBt3594 TaxID=1427578 RepID=A0AAW9QV13_9CHRO
MNPAQLRNELLEEIRLLPDTELERIYQMIHQLRLSVEKPQANVQNTLKFAGSWNDLTEEEFNGFAEEIMSRRQRAFTERRNHETILD